MKNRLVIPSIVLASTLLLTAAGSEVVLTGAGSTFIYPILVKWVRAYEKARPGLKIAYDPVGSGHGIARTLAGTVDFGASDGPLTDAQIRNARFEVVHVPVVLGAVVPAYNLPGITEDVRFTAAALSGIFLGNIKKWNDPELTRANQRLQLPDRDITVIFRADGSGTTYVWTDFLSQASPEWKKRVGVGTTVTFPLGFGARFNEGVVEAVQKESYSIGYIQLTYAIENHVQYGRVQNALGEFVRADSGSITAAAAGTATNMPTDFRVSIVNSADEAAYPISSFTWLLIPSKIADPAKRQAIVSFVRWVLTDGQKLAAPMNYAPLPADVAQRVLQAVLRIQ